MANPVTRGLGGLVHSPKKAQQRELRESSRVCKGAIVVVQGLERIAEVFEAIFLLLRHEQGMNPRNTMDMQVAIHMRGVPKPAQHFLDLEFKFLLHSEAQFFMRENKLHPTQRKIPRLVT